MAEVKINRRSTEALRRVAEEGSLVVVGEPGAGKSGALHDLVKTLHDEGHDVVFLAVDRVEASSLGALRGEIARSETSAQTFRDLIAQVVSVSGRWRVIASIRKFDLRHSQRVRQLFGGTPPTEFQDTEFSGIRHLNIPRLTDEEMDQIGPKSQALANLVARADQTLRDLLRVPFNLRLMGDLLGAGVAIHDLTPVRTQIELLDRYWTHRVIRDDRLGDAREGPLRRAVSEMVQARSLRVDRARAASDTATSAILHDLLSSNILSEWRITFFLITQSLVCC
jgi:hypothetical protein